MGFHSLAHIRSIWVIAQHRHSCGGCFMVHVVLIWGYLLQQCSQWSRQGQLEAQDRRLWLGSCQSPVSGVCEICCRWLISHVLCLLCQCASGGHVQWLLGTQDLVL
jgi:hypothetical protein